jgi:hypothetical protein
MHSDFGQKLMARHMGQAAAVCSIENSGRRTGFQRANPNHIGYVLSSLEREITWLSVTVCVLRSCIIQILDSARIWVWMPWAE